MNRLTVTPVANGYVVSDHEGDASRTFVAQNLDQVDVILHERATLLASGNEASNGRGIELESLSRRLVAARAGVRKPRGAGWDIVDALIVELRETVAAAGNGATPS